MSHFNTSFSPLSYRGAHSVEDSWFTWVSWQALSSHYCNNYKNLIGAEYTKAFRCPHSQKSIGLWSGDHAGQLTRPLCSVHCSPKVWCYLTLWGKWSGVPSYMNHRYCHSWRSTCSKSTGKSFTKRQWYTAPVGLLGKGNWSWEFIIQDTHPDGCYCLDAMVVWGLCSTQTYYESSQYPPLCIPPHQ
jgi:hypothetical protein